MRAPSFCLFVIALFFVLGAFTFTIVGLATDYWYFVSTPDSIQQPETKKENNYAFGLWRRCYDDFPDQIADVFERSGTHCVTVYKLLLPRSDKRGNMTSDEKVVMHLGRSVIGLNITCAVLYLTTIILLILGSIPGDCYSIKKSSLYLCLIIVMGIAVCCSITSGVCFIAARDVEVKDLDMYAGLDRAYGWSFILHWIGTGIAILAGCIMVALMLRSHDSGDRNSKYFYEV